MTEGFDPADFLRTLTHRPGVYRMLDRRGRVLYVGKARDLKRRVASYFGRRAQHPKTRALMNQVASVEVTVTASEQEALLLEYNQIKAHAPRYNVLLRDDKSYPYIYVSTEQPFPRFEFHRGARSGRGRYFGPYPTAWAVREVLGQLQKLFRIRQCRDSFFAHRSRPCLQHQIGRCSAPCVGLIDADSYRRDVANAMAFLAGRNEQVLDSLVAQMDAAAARLDYETAAGLRDQIAAVRRLLASQAITGSAPRDADVLAAVSDGGVHAVGLLMIRNGRVLGSRTLFPRGGLDAGPGEILGAVIAQHYFDQAAPPELLLADEVPERELLAAVLSERAGRRVRLATRCRGQRRQWVQMARENARAAVAARLASRADLGERFAALAKALRLDAVPERIECFDISHTGGESTVAACVAWTLQGADKSGYRRYNIRDAAAGDDYAALAEAVRRRYRRSRGADAMLPDLVLIDGGRGQVAAVAEVLDELQLGGVELAGIAKGEGRRPALDKLYRPNGPQAFGLAPTSPAMHLLQQLRDEAHRFAITGHRQRRSRERQASALEEIPGIGPKRRRALLQRFGGLQGVRRAGVEDLAAVPGISRTLARRIFEQLNGGS